ncbi:MAG: valine--tRNA ligase [Candidatus Paceibacteria bacterium]
MTKLPKAYEPEEYEDVIYESWEESGFFNPDNCIKEGVADDDKDPFSMMLPPPNVTGTLHMGHAVMLATQDLMARYHRMDGKPTEWLPGTDHAAVATESKVEKKLIEEEGYDHPKEEMGREEFMQELEEFAEESKSTIINQAKKMGSSLDWDRYAFTLDEQRNKAVKTVFKNMYDDGLIYRDYRTVNWSKRGQCTCSDDELERETRTAKLYTFVYSDKWIDLQKNKREIEDEEEFPIPISTTRPETKLGDTAIAVHPEGKWSEYIGNEYEFIDVGGVEGNRLRVKVIGSEEVDQDFGSGAVGVTPAHSHVDYEMYRKRKDTDNAIGIKPIINEEGEVYTTGKKKDPRVATNKNRSGDKYADSVEEAREKFVDYLRENDLMKSEPEEVEQNVGKSDRFGDVVEVLPKLQWFIDVNKEFDLKDSQIEGIEDGSEVTLKELMQYVVEEGLIEILPERFEKNYFHWIDNLRDWCISRQIWYGHRIPVWYRDINDEDIESAYTLGFHERTVDSVKENNKTVTYRTTNHELEVGDKIAFENSQTEDIFGYGTIVDVEKTKVKNVPLKDPAHGATYDTREELIEAFKFHHPDREINEETDVWIYTYSFGINIGQPTEQYAGTTPPPGEGWRQDPDTLDTWFSSGLWTFSTLGWPDNKKRNNKEELGFFEKNDLERFHPTTVLETGYDILFFWVARMILMTTYNLGEIPFETVYLHGLVLDENGDKMSKSKGNVIDPLNMKEKYGADATRMSLLIGNTPGNDMSLSEDKIESMKHFSNKLWNISRYILMSIENPELSPDKPAPQTLADEWILDKLSDIVKNTTEDIEQFNFSQAGERLKDFTWSELADWYLEVSKVEQDKEKILNYILNTILKLWHPFIPYVTETLWKKTYGEDEILMVEDWPEVDYNFEQNPEQQMNKFKEVVRSVRDLKNDYNINKASNVTIEKQEGVELVDKMKRHIAALAGVEQVDVTTGFEDQDTVEYPVPDIGKVHLHLRGEIDVQQERRRTKEEIENKQSYITELEHKLDNDGFLNNAPDEVVEQERDKYQQAKEKLQQLQEKLNSLKQL